MKSNTAIATLLILLLLAMTAIGYMIGRWSIKSENTNTVSHETYIPPAHAEVDTLSGDSLDAEFNRAFPK
jgi:hypothetical protein